MESRSSTAVIPFPELPWRPGTHPLERKKGDPLCPIALLEFSPGFADPNWCSRGHAGYVLEGSLRLEFQASTQVVSCGAGFIIDPGILHRASNPASIPVRLVIVSTGEVSPR